MLKHIQVPPNLQDPPPTEATRRLQNPMSDFGPIVRFLFYSVFSKPINLRGHSYYLYQVDALVEDPAR
jgi:hypothetical protein